MYSYRDVFDFNVKWTWKTVSLMVLLALLPNLLGMYSYTTSFGLRIHFFQYLIFLAAIIYGPTGGLISGAFGSIWTAIALHNPYILVGNIILGFFVGFFLRLKWNIIIAVLAAYLIQLPWLWLTDVYLVNMPVNAVNMVVAALFVSNIIWAAGAMVTAKYVKNIFS